MNKDWDSPPSDTILDILEERNMTLLEFSNMMNISENQLDDILNNRIVYTYFIAKLLSENLGSTIDFWLNRYNNWSLI